MGIVKDVASRIGYSEKRGGSAVRQQNKGKRKIV